MKQKLRVEKLETRLSHQPVEFREDETRYIRENISKNPNRVLAVIEGKIKPWGIMRDHRKRRIEVFKTFLNLLSEKTVRAIKEAVYKKLNEKEPQSQNP